MPHSDLLNGSVNCQMWELIATKSTYKTFAYRINNSLPSPFILSISATKFPASGSQPRG